MWSEISYLKILLWMPLMVALLDFEGYCYRQKTKKDTY
jgi:hypothetical protein